MGSWPLSPRKWWINRFNTTWGIGWVPKHPRKTGVVLGWAGQFCSEKLVSMMPVKPAGLWYPILAGNAFDSDDDFPLSEVFGLHAMAHLLSHWAKPQGDALQGIIPHSSNQAEVWRQGPDWSDRGAWPLVKGSQGYGTCSGVLGTFWKPPFQNPFWEPFSEFFYCKTHSKPPSQNPSENPSPEPFPEPSQNLS